MASCGGGLAGATSMGSVYIGNGDCDYSEEMIVYTTQNGEAPMTVPFASECQWEQPAKVGPFRPSRGFFCRRSGTSPLAGTRYTLVVKRHETDECGTPPRLFYACVKGCNHSAPKSMNFISVECD